MHPLRPSLRPLAAKSGVELVDLALGDHARIKDIMLVLSHREPEEGAAVQACDALATERAPAWLVAALLSSIRHERGYRTLVTILSRGAGLLSESYAAAGIVAIAGACAEADLTRVLQEAADEQRAVRQSASWALGEIGTDTAIGAVLEVMKRRPSFVLCAAKALFRCAIDPELLLTWLRTGDDVERLFVIRVFAERTASVGWDRGPSGVELARCATPEMSKALRAELARQDRSASPRDRAVIQAWLDELDRTSR